MTVAIRTILEQAGQEFMSYGLYVGKNHTADGIAFLGGYGDEPSSHWLEIVPACDHQPGASIVVGVTRQADLPGQLSEIPQISHTSRHLRVSYSYYKGVPAPLTNGGLNEHGVAVRDIWSTSRAELIDMTPGDQAGPNYSDLARIVLERAKTAREGVDLIAGLIGSHGYSSYGGNSHIIADSSEAWVVIEFAGGRKLWVAERLNENAIRASRPGFIGEIPAAPDGDFLYPVHFMDLAFEKGWFDPQAGKPFNVNAIYGDGKGPWDGVKWIEAEMLARARRPQKIGLADMFWAVRTETLTGDTAGYGQVVALIDPPHSALRMMWHAPIGALAAPFMPVYLGATTVPEEYRQHRYLTAGEDSRFVDLRHAEGGQPQSLSIVPQGTEATRSAVHLFKRLLYLMMQDHPKFLPEVTAAWEGVENRLIDLDSTISKTAGILLNAGQAQLAQACLDYFTTTELLAGLRLGEQLATGMEARIRTSTGFSPSPKPLSAKQIW